MTTPLFERMLRRAVALLLLTMMSLASLPAAQAQSTFDPAWPARVGRLAEVQGTAWFFDRDEGSWTQAQPNRPLTGGDRISTDRGARVELRIGSVALRLAGETDIVLRRLDDQAIAVDLPKGSLALRASSAAVLSQIEIVTAEGRFIPRTTGHFRIDQRADASEATSWRGSLEFDGRDSRLTIGGGQHAELWLEGPQQTTHYRWVEIERDEFAAWVQRDDLDVDRSETARYVSRELTGWEDLDRYGQWSAHPEYGRVWMPTQVSVGWAPFQDGRWVWVSPWGWTWVDAAPWGFAPFHYGRWVRWGGRWAWLPGPRGAKPAYAPALVQWTFGPHDTGRRPPPPSGWTPLGRHDVFRPHPRPVLPPPRDHAVPPPPRDHGVTPPLPRDRVLPTPWPRDRADPPPPTMRVEPPPPRMRVEPPPPRTRLEPSPPPSPQPRDRAGPAAGQDRPAPPPLQPVPPQRGNSPPSPSRPEPGAPFGAPAQPAATPAVGATPALGPTSSGGPAVGPDQRRLPGGVAPAGGPPVPRAAAPVAPHGAAPVTPQGAAPAAPAAPRVEAPVAPRAAVPIAPRAEGPRPEAARPQGHLPPAARPEAVRPVSRERDAEERKASPERGTDSKDRPSQR